MSIINRLKSLFKEEKEMIEKDIEEKISKDVTDGSSDLNDTIVSGTKTSVPISDVLKKEDKSTATIELKFKKEVTVTKEESVEETLPIIEEDEPSNEEIPDEAEEVSAEESLDVEENTSSEEEDVNTDGEIESAEKVDDDEKEKEDKKRDNMTLLTDKELLTDANRDPEFTAEFIDAGIETVKHCFQCGTCGGGCPSGRRTPYKVRQIVRKCLLGLKEEVITDDALWMCTTCYTCQERCPRSVKIVEIIKKARNVAAHAGYMAKPHKMTGVFVINTGHAVPINDAAKSLRSQIGLSEVPPTTHADAGALEEVKKLCKITAFDDLIGYDEATGGLKE
ncbi:MAG: CoB--CoM heterodisulfide reductase subunit C [Methanobrevibacter millerae]|jgi:heterodisulfide reductase subunit C|uniref:CoB--CoM heterodisulfide reductase subunit C n=1 Tax=Methanobrevibacter millerae TaxID=230361 RepID=A0A8T3VD58_9EURY|nr:CoB--CoM heterodisulfide reductase subunit C [Methanobrevibacter millerae]MBE6505102.1 CoB--CoM heterodisulfide reductase subunit C [Methanobrevibacter millerae]